MIDSNVRVAKCATTDDASQRWLMIPFDPDVKPTADSNMIVSRATGACLDPANTDGARDAKVGLARCDKALDQRWSITGSSPLVKNEASGLCLDVAGYDGAEGARVGLYDCDGHADQDWTMAPETSRWKTLPNRKASTCLVRSGDDATLGSCTKGSDLLWVTVPLPRW